MKQKNEIINEMIQLLQKLAVDSFAPLIAESTPAVNGEEAVLINLKNINARYDKHEAIVHVKALMEKYNIQLDEIAEHLIHR